MPTAEIYRIGADGRRTYAGYAKFDENDNFLGTRGGYGPQERGNNTAFGRENVGNNRRNSASAVQNSARTAGARQAARASR